MSSPEWARYLHDVLDVHVAQDRIVNLVVDKLLNFYRDNLPLIPGARDNIRMAPPTV